MPRVHEPISNVAGELPVLTFDERRRMYEGALVNFLGSRSRLALVTGLPGNVGDRFIAHTTDDLLAHHRIDPERVDIQDVVGGGLRSGSLLVPGSGAMHPLWGDWLPRLLLAASRTYDEVIVLPSGVEQLSPLGCRALGEPNVWFMARDVESFHLVRSTGRAALGMDCALFWDVAQTPRALPVPPDGARLLALREDAGSRLAPFGVLPARHENNDVSATAETVDSWLAAIRAAHSVITDRLHVVVASVLMGRDTFFFETYGRKIGNYVNFAFRNEFDSQLTEVDLEWLREHGAVEGGPVGVKPTR